MSIDLSIWELDTAIKQGNSIQIISSNELLKGYTSEDFYYNPDTSLSLLCPNNGATTKHSKYPRTELREQNVWTLEGRHLIDASLKVMKLAGGKGIIISQIHGTNNKLHPQLIKIYWTTYNTIIVEYQIDNQPGKEQRYSFGSYNLGELISYLISVNDDKITMSIISLKDIKSKLFSFNNPFWTKQKYYFKCGNYLQNNTGDDFGVVNFYKIKVTHN